MNENSLSREKTKMVCKNAAEAKRKFTLFANYRKNSLSLHFVKIVILIYRFEVKNRSIYMGS